MRYPVLTPNLKGFEAALAAGADEVAVFVAATEVVLAAEHQLLDRRKPGPRGADLRRGQGAGVRVRGYISCVLGCPYEGEVDPARGAPKSRPAFALGAYEISLGDTIGVGHRREDAGA